VSGSASAAGHELRPPTPAEFTRLQQLVHRESGIFISDVKRALLVGRLSRRLRELGLESFGAYLGVVEGDDAERVAMLDCLCTNETHFFREPRQFDYLQHWVIPRWVAAAEAGERSRRIHVWSAACSTGEEPYSLAMALLSAFPFGSGWEIQLLATDHSTRALARARAAVWPIAKCCEIPDVYLRRFMLRGGGPQEGLMKAALDLRSSIRFQRLNLNDESYAAPADFDLIFCRNVLIYFRATPKLRVVERLLRHLAPSGQLFLGHAESLTGITDRVRAVGPNVYMRAPERSH
jgi:chemotaxis protein methyltransferase CheR